MSVLFDKEVLWISLFAAVLCTTAQANSAGDDFELVQSAPVETNLAHPDLRHAADVWPEMFAGANGHIDIEEFYIAEEPGEPLDPVLDALVEAGKRGVKVRFIIGKALARGEDWQKGVALLESTIPKLDLCAIDFTKLKGGILHAKYFVVDGKAAFLGSQNFDWRSLKHVHEMGLKITDQQVVGGMSAIFEHDWKACQALKDGTKVPPTGNSQGPGGDGRQAYLVASPKEFNPPGVGGSEAELVYLIGIAKRELYIELKSYAPLYYEGGYYAPVDDALRVAAGRGVRVRLAVADWNTPWPLVAYLRSLSVLPTVEVKIVTIPQAAEGCIPYARLIHTKYMVVDGRTLWLGTSNWEGGYLDNGRNLEVVVHNPLLAAQALQVHERVWNSAYAKPVKLEGDYPKVDKRCEKN